jgi:hypothetical protein
MKPLIAILILFLFTSFSLSITQDCTARWRYKGKVFFCERVKGHPGLHRVRVSKHTIIAWKSKTPKAK